MIFDKVEENGHSLQFIFLLYFQVNML